MANVHSQNCNIEAVFAETHDCNSDENVLVDIEFDVTNPGNQGFEIRGNGQSYGLYDYGEPFYTVGPIAGDCDTLYEFVIIDIENESCSNFYEFSDPICCSDDCIIYNINIDSLSCNADETYNFILNFSHLNTTNQFFDVYADTTLLGFFAYDNLPVYIEGFIPRPVDFDLIRICDNDNPDCCLVHEFLSPECETSECDIRDLEIEFSDCDGDFYLINFEFISENNGGNGFTVAGNGMVHGTFNYGQDSYSIGPFNACNTINEIVIIDNENENCFAAIEFNTPDCCESNEECSLTELFAETFCDTEFVYIDFQFNVDNIGNDGFTVRGNGNVYGSFEYGETFYTIGPLDNCDFNELVIIDNQFENCSTAIGITAPECCTPDEECSITELFAESYCEDDLTFISFGFETDNTGNEGFTVRANGNVYGSFQYGESFYTIGPLENCDFNEIVIIDNQFENCSTDIGMSPPECCTDSNCEIWDLEILNYEWQDEETFGFQINFSTANTGNLGFDLFINGEFHSFQLYSNEPYYFLIEDINNEEEFHITICDNDNENCCTEITYNPPISDCDIDNIVVVQTECILNEYYWVINFDHPFTSDIQEFNLIGNGTDYGTYNTQQLPVSIGPFNIEDEFNELGIKFLEFENCGSDIELSPNCETLTIDNIKEEAFVFKQSLDYNIIESKAGVQNKIQLFSFDSKLIYKGFFTDSISLLNNAFPTGIYYIVITNEQGRITRKIFIP